MNEMEKLQKVIDDKKRNLQTPNLSTECVS